MTRPGESQWQRSLPWMAAALIISVYFWTATLGTGRFDFRHPKQDLYAHLVDAFAAGQLYLKVAPSPDLLRLADPYDPELNSSARLLDASLYRGHYYVYYGVTPVFLWLWPYRAVTGNHPPQGLSVLVFCSAAFLLGCLLIDRVRRIHFPTLSGAAQVLPVLAWGLGNFYGVNLTHHDFFEVAAASAALCLVTMLLALHVSLTSPGEGIGAMLVASIFYGLAVGSRPNLVFSGVVFAAVLGFRYRRARRVEGKLWLAAALPTAVILGALFAYNYARFGNPLEFGYLYGLGAPDLTKWKAFAWSYVPYNAYYYLVSVPRLSVYFPFLLEPAAAGLPPPGHMGVFYVVGFLWACPFVFFAAAAWRVGRSAIPQAAELGSFCLVLTGAFVGIAAVDLGFRASVYRYIAEILTPLLLLAVVGWMALRSAMRPRWLRILLMLGTGTAVAWAAFVNLMLCLDVEDMFRAQSPAQYQRVEKAFNTAVGLAAGALGWKPLRPVITLQFPRNHLGSLEPLLVAGTPPAADFLYVYYVTPRAVQIGFESMGHGGPTSRLIPIDYAASHQLEIEGGLFLPPVGYPWLEKHAGAQGPALTHSLMVRLDGNVVLDGYADFHNHKGRFTFGRSAEEPAFGDRFTGPWFDVAWIPANPTFAASRFARKNYGAATLNVQFPSLPAGTVEPLLSIGSQNRGCLVSVTWLAGGRIQFTLQRSLMPAVVSAALELDPAKAASLEIRLGALYPPADNPLWTGSPVAPAQRLEAYRLELNGRVVLAGRGSFHPAPPDTVIVGKNAVGFSGVAPAFSGHAAIVAREW